MFKEELAKLPDDKDDAGETVVKDVDHNETVPLDTENLASVQETEHLDSPEETVEAETHNIENTEQIEQTGTS